MEREPTYPFTVRQIFDELERRRPGCLDVGFPDPKMEGLRLANATGEALAILLARSIMRG